MMRYSRYNQKIIKNCDRNMIFNGFPHYMYYRGMYVRQHNAAFINANFKINSNYAQNLTQIFCAISLLKIIQKRTNYTC